MQLTQLKVRIHDALLHYKIRDDFNSNSWKEDNNSKQFIEFLQQIKDHYLQKSNCKNNISSDCILLILWELLEYTTIHNIVADEIVSLSIELLSLSSYNGRTICKIFDTMRMGLSTQSLRELLTVTIGNSTETITDNNTISNNEREPQGIPLKYHNQILSALTKFVTEDNPKHITFPGDKESFLQLSYVKLDLVNSYSLAMWIKLDPAMKPDQPFILYRCRCPNAGIDFVVTEYKDGMLSIVIRTQSETKSGTLRDEVKGRLFATSGSWHLITVRHSSSKYIHKETVEGLRNGDGISLERISIAVDSHVEMETDLQYPFYIPVDDSAWVFGLAMQGCISCVTLYANECLPLSLVQLIHSMGPYASDLTIGVACPQNSFDTGHVTLGTLITKGNLAAKCCRSSTVFSINAQSLQRGAHLPQNSPGKLYLEHIEMENCSASVDDEMKVVAFGNCKVTQSLSWIDAWLDAGGCAAGVYLLNLYTNTIKNVYHRVQRIKEQFPDKIQAIKQHEFIISTVFQCISSTLDLLVTLLFVSTELKEQFLQTHSFHVLASFLANLPDSIKKQLITEDFVDKCFSLIHAFGLDGKKGDVIAAALQGMFFDFRLWRSCQMPVLFHLLDRLAILLSDSGEILYRCIGIQQILDVFRLHIVRSTEQELKAVTSIGLEKDLLDVSGDLLNVTDSTHFKRTITVRDCADAVFRLLHSALLAARTIATKLKGTVRHEIEILLTCLDETSNSHVAETVLSIIFELKETVPVVLVQALLSLRYYDTIIVNVLTRKQFTQIIRIRGTTILFWLLSGELKSISSMLLEARKKLIKVVLATMDMNNSASVIHLIDSYHFDGALLPATQPQKNKRKSTVAGSNLSLESARINNLCVQIKEYTKPLEKMWLVLVMITESIKRAIENGSWSSNETNRKFLESDVDALLNSIVVESQPQIWLTLPMMPILLANGSLPTAQTIIMGINVCFKSEENQSEIVASIPERSWIKTFLSIAAVGEKVLREDQDKYSAEDSKKRHLMGDTCVELALDTLAIVVEYKIRQHLNDTKHIWSCLFDCIKVVIEPLFEKVPHLLPLVEAQYQQRLVSLVLQRIVKNNEVWMSPLFAGQVIKIFSLIDEMDLCGSYRHPNSTGKAPSDLVDINDRTIILLNQTTEETQITSFLLDILSSSRRLRRHPIGISIKSVEWKVLKFALHLVLQSLAMTNEDLAERVCQEAIGFLAIISDQNAKFPAGKYKATVMNILQSLRKVIKSNYCRESIRSQYTALMFMIMHFFIDLRHSIAMSNSFENIPDHVVPMMDDLIGIDNCNDIDLIFKLLDVAMRTADPISFEENDQEGAMMLDDDHDHDDNKSISAADEPLLSFDDIEENGNNIIPSQDKVSEVMPAIQTKQVASEGKTSDSLSEISPQSMSSADLASVFGQISQQEDKSREKAFQKWISIRTGISSERIDSERARMTRAMDALDLSYAATDKYWKKVSRKIESECFLQYHRCQWKLGVSHEGYFPGRRRIVLRPRYDYRDYLISNAALQRETNLAQYEDPVLDSSRNVRRMSSGGFNSILSVDEQDNLLFTSPTKEIGSKGDDLDRALARACAGYIKDVTQGDASEATSMERASMDTSNSDNYSNDKIKSGADKSSAITVPGTSWGLVDADDSEEGFGVVGLTMGETAPTGSNFRAVSNEKSDVKISEADSLDFNPLQQRGDMMGDVKQLEENFRQGRAIETGPCYSGTRRVGSGPALLDASVILITASGNFRGTLSFNGKEIFFCSTTLADDSHKKDSASVNLGQNERMRRRRWVLSSVSAIYLRRFRLRDSALEVFFKRGKHRNFFVDFGHSKANARQRNDFARALMTAAPESAFKQTLAMSPIRMVSEHGVQEKWLKGQISNYEYLMALNTIAGRTYNDLCQYPVMPWVIANYESEQLDLSKPENYRDLSKPMGALNPARLKEFLDRFYSFEDNVTTGIPAFMYGSHYSTMVGVVLHFLVRLQPFAALHKEMQNGHFDVPDRLFSSIPRSFKHNTTQLSEVKELTPEWFTTPEIFKNVNNFEFGKTQDGDLVSDVELPPWANSAEEFVRIHRAALESDYVTEHLHEWIDLIFGFKQRGPDSIDACNVFYYLTYYGSVNQYMIKDDGLRKATELQIAHFGQVPMQLFTTPHPPNMSRRNRMQSATVQVPRPLIQAVDQEVSNRTKVVCDEENVSLNAPSTLIRKSSSPFHSTSAVARQKQVTVLSVIVLKERLLCVMSNGVIDMMKYGVTESAKSAIAIAAASRKVDHKRKSTVATKQSSDLMSDSNEKQHENIISFDDEAPIALEAGNTMDDLIDIERKADGSLPVSALLAPDEPLIYVEKEFFHFEEIPRLPLFQIHEDSVGSQADPPILDGKAKANSLRAERVSGLLVFTQSKRLALSAGAIDGRIAVRELDLGIGGVKSAGDFRAHRRRVISICTDNIPSGNTDVVCSCDESGQILVWTISTLKGLHSSGKAQGSAAIKDPFSSIISRRPQRSFRCIPSDQMKCEVSWQLGVVVGVSGNSVSIFSIERDELIRSFITNPDPRDSIREKNAANVTDCSFTGPGLLSREGASMSSNLVADMRNEVKSNLFQANYATRLVVLSDVGALVLYVECCRLVDSLINGDDQTERTHWLLSYTLAGIRTAIKEQHNALTHLSCPARGEVIVTGHNDGSVLFHRYLDLVPLYSFYPHLHSVRMELKLVPSISKPSTRSSVNSQFNAKEETRFEKFNEEIHPSPVIAVAVGPNAAFPALICVTTAAGDVFLKALPDFVKWERFRSPSALAQLANVPLQAVRGTIQQAQNIHVWTTETAGVIAQNARNFADDALEELKKMNKNKLVKGVVNFFGGSKSKDEKN